MQTFHFSFFAGNLQNEDHDANVKIADFGFAKRVHT